MADQVEHFDKGSAPNVLTFTGEELRKRLAERIGKVIDSDLANFFHRETVTDMKALLEVGAPQVLLRIQTLHTLFDAFRKKIKEDYDELLKETGEKVGFNFSMDLIAILKRKRKIAIDYEALFEFWALYDSSADLGEITCEFKEQEKTMTVNVKNNFLTRFYRENPHRHCKWVEGYLKGVIDGIMLQWTRWISKTVFKPPSDILCVASVNEEPSPSECIFKMSLAKEKYSESKDALVSAIDYYKNGDYKEAKMRARLALERGLKVPLGYSDDINVSYGGLLRAYKNQNIPLKHDKWKGVYDQISSVAHKEEEMDEVETLESLMLVKELLDEWNYIPQLSEDQINELQEQKKEYVRKA